MNEKFNKNAKVEKFTTMLGIAFRLIVIDPLAKYCTCTQKQLDAKWSDNKLNNFSTHPPPFFVVF